MEAPNNLVTLAKHTESGIKFKGLFDKYKIDTTPYENVIEQFSHLDLSLSTYQNQRDDTINWNAVTNAIGDCDERILSYFQTLASGNGTINNSSASLEDFSEHLRRTGQAYDFAALKAAALNAAINAGTMMLAGIVIKALSSAWDTINVTAAETQEKIDEITASLAELNSEYDSLSSRDIDLLKPARALLTGFPQPIFHTPTH